MARKKRKNTSRNPRRHAKFHFQARPQDIASHTMVESMRGPPKVLFNLRTLDGGSTGPLSGVPDDYAVCRAPLPLSRVARTLAKITCAGCRAYYTKFIGNK